LAIFYLFIFQMTFFVALSLFHCRREVSNHHFVTLQKVSDKPKESACIEDCLRRRKFVSKLFTSNMTRVIVLFIYLFYICASLNSILRLQVGTDFKLFTPDDSYVSLEMHARQRLYPNYVGFCFAVVKTQNMQWGNTSKRRRLIALYNAL
ncbi:Patched-related protein 9, partial [Toxocara canis]